MDGIREATGREIERDAELIMRLRELARRERKQFRFEREARAVIRDGLVKLLCAQWSSSIKISHMELIKNKKNAPVSSETSPRRMNVSATLSRTSSSPSICFSYIARARSSTSHAALKSSSGSASSSPSPSASASPASSMPSASGLDASAKRSTAGSSPSSSSASPENDKILFPFGAGSASVLDKEVPHKCGQTRCRRFTDLPQPPLPRPPAPCQGRNSARWHSRAAPSRTRGRFLPSLARLPRASLICMGGQEV